MAEYILKCDAVDVMILAEGTFPYVRGGVSSWINQLLNGLSDITFGICFVGSQASDYDGIKYDLPENLKHLEVHYLFGDNELEVKKRHGNKAAFNDVRDLHKWFKSRESDIPHSMKSLSFYLKDLTFSDFLYSKLSWEYINEKYLENAPDVPFIDYFWTLRNIHTPIWKLAAIASKLPKSKLLHAPSTGYAGFLGTLNSFSSNTPFILTEHGIYTRERKIDMLTADWIDFHKPSLLKQPEEVNYIKQMWVNFFEKIGEFAYARAEHVYSLYPGAQKIQHAFGAETSKTEVIVNGVDVDALNATLSMRDETQMPVITLIGRVVSIKDIKTFIRAVRIVANEIDDFEAWIVGPMDEDEEYADECKNMVESLGLEEKLKFLGFQNIKDILPKTRIQTLTSISEGMPLVILEGFAAGVPCVSTDVGSCRDLIEGGLDDEDIALGHAGSICTIASPTDLATEYIRYIKDDEAFYSAQKVALKRVDKYYRVEMFLESYRDIYNPYLGR